MNEEPLDAQGLAELLAQQTAALQAIATRPVKSSTTTYTTDNSVPRALQDMIKNRDRVRLASQELDQALQARETLPYTLASALSAVPQQQGYGSWLSDFARGLGGGGKMLTDAQMARAQMKRENEMEDLAMILAYDKAMGNIGDQTQRQYVSYVQAPYALGSGKGNQQEQEEPEHYDFSPPEMPDDRYEWGELTLQSNRIDPQTNVRTGAGVAAKMASDFLNEGAREAAMANKNAYTKIFTQKSIEKIAKKMGGSRGIDTIPEVNLKGGPEISPETMDSKTYISAVRDQAWDIGDEIIKANPKAPFTRTQVANWYLNNYNHKILPKYRIVDNLPEDTEKSIKKQEQPTTAPVAPNAGIDRTQELLDYYGL